MTIRKNFRAIVVLLSSVAACLVYYTNHAPSKQPRPLPLSKAPPKTLFAADDRADYAIFTPYCKMLAPDPWDESIQKYLTRPQSLICSRLPVLTYVDQLANLSNVLKIDEKAESSYKIQVDHVIKCCYSVIRRINQNVENYNSSADSLYELSNCTTFKNQVLLPPTAEFLLVHCHSQETDKKKGKEIYRNVHPVIPLTPEVSSKLERQKKLKETRQSITDKLNVIILGVDSLSKLNFRRTMPKTLKYLQQNNWVELNGYNKVGENTFPNLMAILSGEPMQTLEDACWANHSQKMDDCPAIWKEYDQRNYVTLYAEDTPSISTFNLLRTGFVQKPTDYYMRPFMLAAHELLHLKILNGLPVCLGPVLIADHVFDYAKKFFRAFNYYNYFSLLWLNGLSHNDVNAPRALDISLHRFLNELSDVGSYNNSLILLLSDHGVRFGEIRETFLGYLEERLPFMFIWYPSWFRKKHPEKYNNLLINQNRLTSPYDVYVTLKKLTDENEDETSTNPISPACPKCKSLLEEQPMNRTCADASVDVNWCLCSEYRDVSVRNTTILQIGKFLYKSIVNYTNDLVRKEKIKKSLCSKWKFLRVFRAQEILLANASYQYSVRNMSNAEVARLENQTPFSDIKIFVIIIELKPGNTKFESTVRIAFNTSSEISTFAFLEPPKRLDSIYKTSKCVQNLLLKHFCYCDHR